MDGKEPKHGGGHSILTAVAVPSQYYLGSALVDEKTNEIPVVRQRFQKLDLEGRYVSLAGRAPHADGNRLGFGAGAWRSLHPDSQRQPTRNSRPNKKTAAGDSGRLPPK